MEFFLRMEIKIPFVIQGFLRVYAVDGNTISVEHVYQLFATQF